MNLNVSHGHKSQEMNAKVAINSSGSHPYSYLYYQTHREDAFQCPPWDLILEKMCTAVDLQRQIHFRSCLNCAVTHTCVFFFFFCQFKR